MAIHIELSSRLAAAPENVWKLLAEPAGWSSWWDDCADARAVDFKALREGSKLEVVLQAGERKTTYRPIVDLLTEGRTMSVTHRSPWIAFTIVWYLEALPDGCKVSLQADFAGVGSLFWRLLRRETELHATLRRQLWGLKKLAERMV